MTAPRTDRPLRVPTLVTKHGSSTRFLGGAILLDRDGVVNVQHTGKYVHSWSDFAFMPRALEAFVVAATYDLPIFVVTNQGGIGRGFFTAEALEDVHNRMISAITDIGGRIDGVVHCPHAPSAGCPCRKPQPGMILALQHRFGIDLATSIFIGDNLTDLQAGDAAGTRTILVGTGEGAKSCNALGIATPPSAGFRQERLPTVPSLLGVACDILDGILQTRLHADEAFTDPKPS